jgi:hypothetical protein
MSGRADEKKQESGVPGGPPAVRKLQAEGEVWHVREVDSPPLDRRSMTHLVFESLYTMRRLRKFPSNWFQLSDEDLYALSCEIRQGD